MERRHQQRQITDAYTSLHYPPLGLLQVRIGNFSDTGLFIELRNIHLSPYSEAQLIECINKQLVHTTAQIVRVTPQGAGLRFLDREPVILQRLRAAPPRLTAGRSLPLNNYH